MTKGRVLAAAAALITFFAISAAAQAQYPPPKGSLVCSVAQASVTAQGSASFTVVLRDGSGLPVSGQLVTFSIVSGDGRLANNTAVTNAAGNATVTVVSGTSVGNLTVNATAGSGLECRAIAQVLAASVFVPPTTGDAGLIPSAGGLWDKLELVVIPGTAVIIGVVILWLFLGSRVTPK